MTRTSPIAFCRRSATTSTSAPYHGSSSAANVTRDCRARERGHRLRFDSAPLDTGPGATDPCGGRSRHPTRRRRIEAETALPPPRTPASGYTPAASAASARVPLNPDHPPAKEVPLGLVAAQREGLPVAPSAP